MSNNKTIEVSGDAATVFRDHYNINSAAQAQAALDRKEALWEQPNPWRDSDNREVFDWAAQTVKDRFDSGKYKPKEKKPPAKKPSQGSTATAKTKHLAHETAWKATVSKPDYCYVGDDDDVVGFNSFAYLDKKLIASPNVKLGATSTPAFRVGDVSQEIQSDAGSHVTAGSSLGGGFVKFTQGAPHMVINGRLAVADGHECLVNCDATGFGGTPGRVVTEVKSTSAQGNGSNKGSELPPGKRTSAKLEELRELRAKLEEYGKKGSNDIDEYVRFDDLKDMMDDSVQGTSGTWTDQAAQVGRGLMKFGLGFGEGAVGMVKLGLEYGNIPLLGAKSVVDAEILAENIRLGNINSDTIADGAKQVGGKVVDVGTAIIVPPDAQKAYAKGNTTEAVTIGTANFIALGSAFAKGGAAAKAAPAADSASVGKAGTAKTADGGSGYHVKKGKNKSKALDPIVLADKKRITQLSNEAADLEKQAKAAREAGDDTAAKHLEAAAQAKIGEAREVLQDFVDSKDVQGLLDRLDVSSPKDGAHFWSGWTEGALDKAAEMSQKGGGISLESTPGGRIANGWEAINNASIKDEFWSKLSQKYASGAEGQITIVHSDPAWATQGGGVWQEVELPEIVQQGKVTGATLVDLNGGVREAWSFEDLMDINQKIQAGGL